MRMKWEEAEAALREKTGEYLTSRRGVTIKGRYTNGTSRPFTCINPLHDDKNPSMFYNYESCKAICMRCKAKYDIFDLVGEDYHISDFPSQLLKAAEIYGIEVDKNAPRKNGPETDGQKQDKTGQHTHTDVYTHTHTHKAEEPEKDFLPYYEACEKRLPETGYPTAERCLSAETLKRHKTGYDPAFKTRSAAGELVEWKAFIMPTGRGSFVARNTDPSAGKGDRYRKRGPAQIFYPKALYSSSSPVFVVEGEIDAMSIEEAGGAAVGLGSYDNVPLLLRILEEKRPSQPLIIALDNEAEEQKAEGVKRAEDKLREGLERLRIPYYTLNPYGSYKDANEALVKDREGFSEAIRGAARIESQAEDEAREAYLSTSAGAHLQDFLNGITESAATEAIPTGFNKLDGVLDGGLYEGLITVGGISSLGKTSLIMQIADQIAAAGTDVLIFSLEMSRSQLMSKSISRHTIQIARAEGMDSRNAKTARGITAGSRYKNYSRTELDLIHMAMAAYQQYADRIFIQEGVGDIGVEQIRRTVERHILSTGGKWITDGGRRLSGGRRPVVVVDYLQILAPYNERATDKQNTDKAVLELKRISRDYKLPVIAISSFNRSNYKTAADFEAFKESGAIEYSSDVSIGLQLRGAGDKNFDSTEAKKKNPREIELVILKNRDAGVGDKISFAYYPMFNLFDET